MESIHILIIGLLGICCVGAIFFLALGTMTFDGITDNINYINTFDDGSSDGSTFFDNIKDSSSKNNNNNDNNNKDKDKNKDLDPEPNEEPEPPSGEA